MALARERARPEDCTCFGAVLAVACAALFGVRDNVVRWAAEDYDPPILAATTASLLAATLFVLGWVLAGAARTWEPSYDARLLRSPRRGSRSAWPTRRSSPRSTADE